VISVNARKRNCPLRLIRASRALQGHKESRGHNEYKVLRAYKERRGLRATKAMLENKDRQVQAKESPFTVPAGNISDKL
jgi:hypothetical protein